MPRGRKPKQVTEAVVASVKVDQAKLLKQFEQEHELQLKTLYKDLADMKDKVNYALRHVGLMDECETIAEAAFKAGRVYGPLDKVNDKLEEMLENLYSDNDLDHWDDVTTCC
jgi:hypothetical protein